LRLEATYRREKLRDDKDRAIYDGTSAV
jgi:hypothetical protein